MEISSISLSSTPQFLWTFYVEYLWNYTPNSIVSKTAYSFKVLALALLLPILILILLLIDITSYTIARTLGVVDIVKASTSDKQTVHARREPPSIHIREADSSPSIAVRDSLSTLSDVRITEYFTSGDHNLELSGVGVFSPATSRPPSPTISRRKLEPEFQDKTSQHDFEIDDGSVHFRRRNRAAAAHEFIPQ
ncbi:hypothetical protein J3R30DRAFT_3655623 [Lentinula aciculospora]|uniref:Uncharacterized protein n=1 Tax=Lentinula aciculospora TaxID=153920 RepID=A0A9W9AJM3_9AGAR|nr:hypothetical protein J3R30DRAFT_3655623 [Lentinula aciculospora]